MEYEKYLNSLTVAEVKQIVTYYNKVVKIPVSKSSKEQLIQHLLKHTNFDRSTRNISIKPEFVMSRKSADDTKITVGLFKNLDAKAREELRVKLIKNTTDEARKTLINKIVDKAIEGDKKRTATKTELSKGIKDRASKSAARKQLVSKLDESMALSKGIKDRASKSAARKQLVSKLDESMALSKGIKDRATKSAARKQLVSKLDASMPKPKTTTTTRTPKQKMSDSMALSKGIEDRAAKRTARKQLVSKLDASMPTPKEKALIKKIEELNKKMDIADKAGDEYLYETLNDEYEDLKVDLDELRIAKQLKTAANLNKFTLEDLSFEQIRAIKPEQLKNTKDGFFADDVEQLYYFTKNQLEAMNDKQFDYVMNGIKDQFEDIRDDLADNDIDEEDIEDTKDKTDDFVDKDKTRQERIEYLKNYLEDIVHGLGYLGDLNRNNILKLVKTKKTKKTKKSKKM